tara:strand:- start:162 stop:662 length:501 start_codon:yes stop_codon:yes gene_type:complete
MEGNAAGVFLAQQQGLKAIEDRFKSSMNSEPILRDAIAAEKVLQKNARDTYKSSIENNKIANDRDLAAYNALGSDSNGNKIDADNRVVKKPKGYELYKKENVAAQIINTIPPAATNNKSAGEVIDIKINAVSKVAKAQGWKINSVIEMKIGNKIEKLIWTGKEFIN